MYQSSVWCAVSIIQLVWSFSSVCTHYKRISKRDSFCKLKLFESFFYQLFSGTAIFDKKFNNKLSRSLILKACLQCCAVTQLGCVDAIILLCMHCNICAMVIVVIVVGKILFGNYGLDIAVELFQNCGPTPVRVWSEMSIYFIFYLSFGGKIVIFRGDFRQCLPVQPLVNRSEFVDLSIEKSLLWHYFIFFFIIRKYGCWFGTKRFCRIFIESR